MKKVYKIVQAKNGKDNTYWLNIGIGFQENNKFSLRLDTLPLPNEKGEVWLHLYEKEQINEISQKNEQA